MKLPHLVFASLFCILMCFSSIGEELQPFTWSWDIQKNTLGINLSVPDGFHLYADQTSVELRSAKKTILPPSARPNVHKVKDPDAGEIMVYEGGKNRWTYPVTEADFPLKVRLLWQGCSISTPGKPGQCFFPVDLTREIASGKNSAGLLYGKSTAGKEQPSVQSKPSGTTSVSIPPFEVKRTLYGYHSAEEFTAFLKGDQKPGIFSFEGKGIFLILILSLIGGIALNLTPCVLPMIPINLAIIGAGAKADKKSAVIRGTVYASGIALAYGTVGVVAVLGGATFGQLDSYWIFNVAVSAVFVVLGLSMFDVFNIDFSRYGSNLKTPSGAKLAGVFMIGVISALLAGACVAPVVIAVLLQASQTYASGNAFGLLLPFVLGLGMGLPWPIVAFGLVSVPKPGAWMKYVKYTFGVLIILIGFYYAWLGGRILLGDTLNGPAAEKAEAKSLAAAFEESARTGKLVMIDFWASWCKNCTAMDLGTMKDPKVRDELKKFVFVKYDATNISEPAVKSVLDRFKVSGLPTFIIAEPSSKERELPGK